MSIWEINAVNERVLQGHSRMPKKAADAATQYLWVKKYKKQREKQKEESMNILI